MEVHCGVPETGRLSYLSGPDRGLSACPHLGETQEIPSFQLRDAAFSVPGIALRSDCCPESVYQTPGRPGSASPVQGDSAAPLPGRRPNSIIFRGEGSGGLDTHSGGPAGPRFCGEQGQEFFGSCSTVDSSGASPRHLSLSVHSFGGQTTGLDESSAGGVGKGQGVTHETFLPSGSHGLLPGHSALVQVSPASSPGVPAPFCLANREQDRHFSAPDCRGKGQSPLVALAQQVSPGNVDGVAHPGDSHDGCVLAGVGSPHPGGIGTGAVEPDRAQAQHQLLGAEGYPPGLVAFPASGSGQSCSCPDGQHDGKGICQQAGRDQVPSACTGSSSVVPMGRKALRVLEGRTSGRKVKRGCRLAKSTVSERHRVATTSGGVSVSHKEMGDTGDGSVCFSNQRSAASVHDEVPLSGGRRHRRPSVTMAQGPTVRLSPSEGPSPIPQAREAVGGEGNFGGSTVAQATVVRGRGQHGGGGGLGTAAQARPSSAGASLSSAAGDIPANSVDIERQALLKRGFSSKVINTILGSRKVSTSRMYSNTWRLFRSWSLERGFSPLKFKVKQILLFLQDGMDKGLSLSTLRRQVSALRGVLGSTSMSKVLVDPMVSRFLKGVQQVRPPQVHHFPSWDLPLVLDYLSGAPFEPLYSSDLKDLTFKTLFLVAATSARRVSELGALSINPSLCIFHSDKVVLRPDPAFIPKVNSWFHRTQELAIPSLCPKPTSHLERKWHRVDARRALKHYIERTAAFRKTDCLFVLWRGSAMGKRPARSTLSKWLKSTIASAYLSSGKQPPDGITAHSIRSAATSAAFEGFSSIESICKAATWASPNTFIKHYKVDVAASADAAFGRRVLQTMVRT